MVLEPTFDKELEKEGMMYKLRSLYTKRGLLHIKFETKFGVHRGTFKQKLLCINPETNREFFYDEIEKAVKQLYNGEHQKKYVDKMSLKIDKIFKIKNDK